MKELLEYLESYYMHHYRKYPEGVPWWNTKEERIYGAIGFEEAMLQIKEYFSAKEKN